MPKKLSVVSYTPDDHGLRLDDDEIRGLEESYGTTIPPEARSLLQTIAERYIDNRQSELARQSWRDVSERLPAHRKAAQALWAIAYDDARGDAVDEFEDIFYGTLAEQVVSISPERGDLLMLTPHGDGWRDINRTWPLPEGGYGVRVSKELLRNLAMELMVAVEKSQKTIQAAIEMPEAPIPPQRALDALILALRQWADAFNLPIAAYVDGETPDKFPRFAHRLLQMVPEAYREVKPRTVPALAARVKRVYAEFLKAEREQNRRRLLDENAPFNGE